MDNPKENELLELIKSLQAKIEALEKPKKIGKRPKKKPAKVKLPKEVVEKVKKKAAPNGKVWENSWVDDGSLCKKERDWDKKYGKHFIVSERNNPEVEIIDIKCSNCGATEPINKIELLQRRVLSESKDDVYWVCSNCARGSR